LFSGAYGLQLVCFASFPFLNIHIPVKEYGMACHTLPLAKSRVIKSSLTYTHHKWLDIISCWLIRITGSGFPMPTSFMNGKINQRAKAGPLQMKSQIAYPRNLEFGYWLKLTNIIETLPHSLVFQFKY
jgi:hypothetical protein